MMTRFRLDSLPEADGSKHETEAKEKMQRERGKYRSGSPKGQVGSPKKPAAQTRACSGLEEKVSGIS